MIRTIAGLERHDPGAGARFPCHARGSMLATLLVVLAAGPLLAATPSAAAPSPAIVSIVAKADGDKLAARWPDVSGAPQKLVATFPPGTISAAEVLHFDHPAIMATLAERLQAWATANAPGVTLELKDTKLTVQSAGVDAAAADAAMAAATAERERLYAMLLAEHHLGRVGPGQLQYDHARIAAESAPLLAPLATALGPATDTRAFAERALALVQGIPYEKVTRDTFAPPLALLREQHGDCDEKSTLYAALIRAVAPELPLAILTMRDHAIVGLGLPAGVGDRTVTVEGTAWVIADPAGPNLHPLGRLGSRTDLTDQLSVRVVP